MRFEEAFADPMVRDSVLGGVFGSLLVIGIVFILLLIVALYVYFALAWQTIAKRRKYKHSWLAWIPFANWAMILSLGGFYWAWIFLLLIPIFGWIALYVIGIIAHWRIFEKLNYPGWLSLSMLIPKVGWLLYAIAIGFVAWKKK